MDVIKDCYLTKAYQDLGHTNYLHDVDVQVGPHYGLFLFDLRPFKDDAEQFFIYLSFKFVSKYLEFTGSTNTLLGTFKVGFFTNPSVLETNYLITDQVLNQAGFTLVSFRSGHSIRTIEKQLYSDELQAESVIEFASMFNFRHDLVGVLFVPEVTEPEHFKLRFYVDRSSERTCPLLKLQVANLSLTSQDVSSGLDETKRLDFNFLNKSDQSVGKDLPRPSVFFKQFDSVKSTGKNQGIRIFGYDYSRNYSMAVTHLVVNDRAQCLEVYGFNGYTERYYYPDYGRFFEKVSIEKLNYVTWSGLLIEWPWCVMLWYGEIVYFADQEEFNLCCRTYFKSQEKEKCPICGQFMGKHLKYSYIDVTRIPHQLYFCSEECLAGFDRHMMRYINALTKANPTYPIGVTGNI